MTAMNTTMLDSESKRQGPAEAMAESVWTGDKHRPRILVATETRDAPRELLELARELVRMFGAELHLLRVKTSSRPQSTSDSKVDSRRPGLVSLVQRDDHSLAVAEGEFVSAVSDYALELDASLVIVPGYTRRGRDVTKLVRSSGRAVLVARRRLVNGTVLAATHLADPQFPVVRRAGELGSVAQVSVVAVHNVCPSRVQLDLEGGRITRIEADGATTRQLQALVQVTSSFKIQTAVLTSLLDPVDAILREARSRDASLVVVGAHVDGPAVKRTSVSSDVVNLAQTSVLVVPLPPAEARPALSRIDPAATTA